MQPQSSLRTRYLQEIKNCKSPKGYLFQRDVSQMVKQVEVYRQRHQNLCGFHALSSLMSFDQDHLELLLSEDEFIRNYQLLGDFIGHVLQSPTYSKDVWDFMPFERVYLDAILQHKQSLKCLADKEVATFTYGNNYIQNSPEELARFTQKIKEVRTGHLKTLFVVAGINVHWTLLVISSTPEIRIYNLDSLGYPLKDVLDGNSRQLSQAELNGSYCRDLKSSITIILDLLTSEKDIMVIKFQGQLKQMLDSFDTFSQSRQRVVKWIQEQYPVPVIRNDVLEALLNVNVDLVDPKLMARFRQWARIIKQYQPFDTANIFLEFDI